LNYGKRIAIIIFKKKGENMKVETIPVGYLQANCYLVTQNNQTIIIDPGDEYEKIRNHCLGKNIVAILVTHHHFDHIGALKALEETYHLKHNVIPNHLKIEIFQNPGHSKDSISFYFPEENILFSGDFIFYHSIGRCDLEGGDWQEMQNSIKSILKYSHDLFIYPGHGPSTTLKEERPYLSQYI